MRYPKIGLEVNLGEVEGRGGLRAGCEEALWHGVEGEGKSLIAIYPENFVLISQLEVSQEGGG